jgi:2-keto-4-pentenoate hydratase
MSAPLSDRDVERAVDALLAARMSNTLIDGLPEGARPESMEDAYRIQDRFIEKLGRPVGGYFAGCTNRVIQERLGIDEPYSARLFESLILPAPGRIVAASFPQIVLECEFTFIFAHDLECRQRPYSTQEVRSAVLSVHPSIELVAGHLRDWPRQDIFSVIADNGTDGALIYGEGQSLDGLDLTAIEVALSINGEVRQRGSGARVLGHPIEALTWLVNSLSQRGRRILAGHVFNTGTATDIQPAGAGDVAVADFGVLGCVELKLE